MSRRHHVWPFAVVLFWAGAMLVAPPAAAQTLTLSINPSTISFADADPDTTPTIEARSIRVRYRVRNNAAGNWQITLTASGDLTAGTATIPISDVTWSASPSPPFQDGTLSSALAQTLASGTGNVQATQNGDVVFRLANRWTHNVGTYTASVVFTLIAP